MAVIEVDVAIIGGGPFGLMLANELGRRNVSATLFDKKPSTAFNPQANATQARTMEHYRRLGFVEDIRALGLPEDFTPDIAYFTRYAGYELARFEQPSAREARVKVAQLGGAWSAAELPHRVSQKYVEQVLRSQAEKLSQVSLRYGWELTRFEDKGDHVVAQVEEVDGPGRHEVFAKYLIGGDGGQSFVRKQLGISYQGEGGAKRDFFGGQMMALYLRAPDYFKTIPHKPAWMSVTLNDERRAYMVAVNGADEFVFHTQLKEGEDKNAITHDDARAIFETVLGAPLDIEILSLDFWTAGYTLVAEKMRENRVFIGGDAAHLFTPTGGLGYNTAVEDAVNLGWKLSHSLKNPFGPQFLDSYELERRPAAQRNTSYARGFADSLGLYLPPPGLEDDSAEGENARKTAGEHLDYHGRHEFNIPGVTFGTRYDSSPLICSDGTAPPPDSANDYIPSACPGGRAPHFWFAPKHSLYDEFGFGWTLLRLGPNAPAGERIIAQSAKAGLSLKELELPQQELRDLYEAPLALIRPDQIVAWRGESDEDADNIIKRLTGFEI